LVTHNNEIWDQCKDKLHGHSGQFNQLSGKLTLDYRCVAFNKVTAQTNSGRGVVFWTQFTEQVKTFSVTCFLDPLRTAVIPVLGNYGMLNYMEYLKWSFILEKSILFPFLAILKDHLEEFQVFLGSIESWLLGSNDLFLQEIFNVRLGENVWSGLLHELRAIPSNDNSHYNIKFDLNNNKG